MKRGILGHLSFFRYLTGSFLLCKIKLEQVIQKENEHT